jgi:hypothetical protein
MTPPPTSDQSSEVRDQTYRFLTAAAVVLISTGTIVYRVIEDWTWVDSAYFSVVAVTTVGFGDIHPSTDVSKLFTIFYILCGVAIITSFLKARMRHRTQEMTGSSDQA